MLDTAVQPQSALVVVAATLAAVIAPSAPSADVAPGTRRRAPHDDVGGLTVSVPADLGTLLGTEAARFGMTPAALAMELLATVLDPAAPLLDAVLGPRRPRDVDHFSDGSDR